MIVLNSYIDVDHWLVILDGVGVDAEEVDVAFLRPDGNLDESIDLFTQMTFLQWPNLNFMIGDWPKVICKT